MNRIYKVIWNNVKHCYVVVSEIAKSRSKSTTKKMKSSTIAFVALLLLSSTAFASGSATVSGQDGTDTLTTIAGGTDISVTQNGDIITIGAVYDPVLETLRNYIRFNADYNSGTSFPWVASNSANSFAWGKNAGISVYAEAEKSEKNIAIGANSRVYAGNMSNPSKNTGSNTAIGADAVVGSTNIYATYSTVVGTGAKAYGASNVVVGNGQAGLNQQIGLKSDGTKIWANADNAVVVGSGAAAYSDKATAIGGAAIAGKKATRTDYTDRSQAENAKITYTTAVGYGAHAFGLNSTAVGAQTISTGQQNISLGTGSEARKDNTMSVGFHAIASASDATAIGHDAVVFGDGGLAIGHLVFTGMPALDGYRNNNLDESYLASPDGMRIAGDSKIYFRTDDGTVLKYEVKIGNNGEEAGKYYKVKAVPTGNSWKFVKVNAAGEEVADNSPDAVQYLAKETMKKDTRTSGKVNHIDYFYIDGQESSSKIYPSDEGVAIGTYVSTEGSRSLAIGMSSTAHNANNTALGLYSNTFGKDAVAIGHATLTGARGLIETDANTGEHTISYQVSKQGVSERTTLDGTIVAFDKNFAYEFSDGTNTLKVQNGKIVAVGDTAYTQTGMKLASNNTAVYRDEVSGYLYYTSSGVKHLVKSDEDIIVNGSGGALTVSAGKMILSNGGLSIGAYTHAEGDKSLAFGNTSGAIGQNSVAVGKFANAYGEGSIAFGSDAVAGAEVTTNADGHKVLSIVNKTGQIVLEDGKPVSGAVAFGNYAHATASNSLAFGTDAEATAKNSVAIGAGSVADAEDTVSVGTAEQTRTIVHVTAGVNDTDAVNVSQLRDKATVSLDNITADGKAVIVGLTDVVAGNSNISVTPATDADGKRTYTIAVNADGVIEEDNTGVVTGGAIYEAIQNAQDPNAVKYDTDDHDAITLGGTSAMDAVALTNVADGTLAENSTDAVNGGQLYTVQQLAQEAKDGLNDRATVSLNNINDSGKAVITGLTDVVSDGAGVSISSSTDTSGKKTYTVGLTPGEIASGNTGVVNGGQIYDYVEPLRLRPGNNIEIENGQISAVGFIKYDDGSNKSLVTLEGTRGTKITNAKQASISRNSSDVVIGSQLWQTNMNIEGFAQDIRTNSDNIAGLTASVSSAMNSISRISGLVDTMNTLKADASLNNLTDNGQIVVESIALNAVQEYLRDNNPFGAYGTPNNPTNNTGTNSTNSTNTNNNLLGGTNSNGVSSSPRLLGTTNVSAVRTFSLGAVNPVANDNDVTDDNVDNANTDNSSTVSVLRAPVLGAGLLGSPGDNPESLEDRVANVETSVDNLTNSVIPSIETSVSNLETDLNGKISGIDSRVTATEDAITSIQTSVSDLSTVKADKSYVDTQLDTKADKNSVYTKEETDTKLEAKADKDSVYTKDETNAKLADKANVSLDNLSEEGKDTVKGLARDSIVVKGNDNVFIDTEELDGKKTFTVNVATSDSVAEGSTEIVTGGAVYNAIEEKVGKVSDGNYVSSAFSIAENVQKLDTAIGSVTDGYFVGSDLSIGENLNRLDEQVAQNTMDIGSLRREQQKLGNRIDETGAKAAALAGLHPVEEDGDQRWNIAAGFGNYRGETSGAVGVFYRPKENMLVNLASTVDDHDAMISGGISIALDKGSVGMSKHQMANTIRKQQEAIDGLRKEVADMKQVMMEYREEVRKLREEKK